ncbi:MULTISPECIES: sialidase family protein [unclassified Spirosoma]|uniref:sialidase family protein n=1 Tax=unclassified Spirosoma TaxID=2621999 RepID=UPI0025E2345A|nr:MULTISPECIES: sialidase family protein [unclassified Spirosoma]
MPAIWGLLFPLSFLLVSSAMAQGVKTDDTSERVLRLDPGDNNPRNSEGDFVTLNDGRLLFIYSHYTGKSTDDHAPAYLAGRYSRDGGKTWSAQDRLIVDREGDMNVMSVSLLRLRSGKIGLFYLKKNSTMDCIPMMRTSSDEGQTWSQPVACITDKKGYFVLNNNRVIQLKNGRLMMAVALHRTPETAWENKATLFSYISDDEGKTWTTSEPVPNPASIVTQEPGLIELKDGRIMMFIRADQGFQAMSFSADQGKTWSAVQNTTIYSPLSPASIARIPSTGDLLMVWNNNKTTDKSWHKGARTPLTIAVSSDEGKSWKHIRDIETDPDGWYCYTAIHFTAKDVLLGYCAGSQSAKTHLSVLQIRKMSQKSLYK